jgi:hypothetical protein
MQLTRLGGRLPSPVKTWKDGRRVAGHLAAEPAGEQPGPKARSRPRRPAGLNRDVQLLTQRIRKKSNKIEKIQGESKSNQRCGVGWLERCDVSREADNASTWSLYSRKSTPKGE